MKKLIVQIILLLILGSNAFGATYNIGPGQTYETFTALVATENLAAGDIVDGGGNTFAETWTVDGSGTSGNPIILRNAIIDGEDTRASGIVIANYDYIDIINVDISGCTGDAISTLSGAALTNVTDCEITITAGRAINIGGPGTISGCTISMSGATATAGIYTLLGAGGGALNIDDTVFNSTVSNSNQPSIFVRGYGTHVISDCTFNQGTSSSAVVNYGTTETGTIEVTGCEFTQSVAATRVVSFYDSGNVTLDFNNNDVNVSAGVVQTGDIINVRNRGKTVIDSNNVVLSTASTGSIVNLISTGTSSGVSEITNNNFTSFSTTGYIIEVGTETTTAGDNDFDGTVITGNTITGNGGINHAVFVGFSINAVVTNNILVSCGYGVVLKSSTGTYTSGGVGYNVFNSCVLGVRLKGIKNVPIYNNTFYDTVAANYFIYLSENGVGEDSTGTVIKNNIFYGPSYFLFSETASAVGLDSDYNNVYHTGATPFAGISVTDYTVWADWTTYGQDANSIITDPSFASPGSTFTLNPDSPCINAGTFITGIHDQATAATDLAGTSILTVPDIGAYESSGNIVTFVTGAAAGGNGTPTYPYNASTGYDFSDTYSLRTGATLDLRNVTGGTMDFDLSGIDSGQDYDIKVKQSTHIGTYNGPFNFSFSPVLLPIMF